MEPLSPAELFPMIQQHYLEYGCVLISFSWHDPPEVLCYKKADVPEPPVPDFMPPGTTVKFREPKRVFPK